MVLMSFMVKYEPTDPLFNCGRTIDVKLKILVRERNMVQYSLAVNTFDADGPPVEFRDLDNLWHFLLVKFRKPSMVSPWQIEVFLDSLELVSKTNIIIPLRNVDS